MLVLCEYLKNVGAALSMAIELQRSGKLYVDKAYTMQTPVYKWLASTLGAVFFLLIVQVKKKYFSKYPYIILFNSS